jgi:hypothetical protein
VFVDSTQAKAASRLPNGLPAFAGSCHRQLLMPALSKAATAMLKSANRLPELLADQVAPSKLSAGNAPASRRAPSRHWRHGLDRNSCRLVISPVPLHSGL